MQVEYFCKKCGHKLHAKVYQFVDDIVRIKVEPCKFCIDVSNEKGFEEGKEQGYSDGLISGQTS